MLQATKPFNVLVLCTGNICRSPVAEAMLTAMMASYPNVSVQSAGLAAPIGVAPEMLAVQAAADIGYEVSETKRSRQVSFLDLQSADLILVMSKAHKYDVQSRFPGGMGKCFLLGHWENREIDDPIGRDLSFFMRVTGELVTACKSWADRIGGIAMSA